MKYHVKYIIYKRGKIGYDYHKRYDYHFMADTFEQAKHYAKSLYLKGDIFEIEIFMSGESVFKSNNLPKPVKKPLKSKKI